MSWFSRNWDGVHLEGCEQYEEDDPPALADCQCPELMTDHLAEQADYMRKAQKEGTW